MKCLSLSLVIFLILKSPLSDIHVTTMELKSLVFLLGILPTIFFQSIYVFLFKSSLVFWSFFFAFFLFRAALAVYGSSQARGQIRAAAASLSHNKAGSEMLQKLHHSSWQRWILNPWSEARDQAHILMDTSWDPKPTE